MCGPFLSSLRLWTWSYFGWHLPQSAWGSNPQPWRRQVLFSAADWTADSPQGPANKHLDFHRVHPGGAKIEAFEMPELDWRNKNGDVHICVVFVDIYIYIHLYLDIHIYIYICMHIMHIHVFIFVYSRPTSRHKYIYIYTHIIYIFI